MSVNPIEAIIEYQVIRGMDRQPFDVVNENTNIVEELLEAQGYDIPKEERPMLKRRWFSFAAATEAKNKVAVMTAAMIVDAYCDVIVFAIGAILKLGYDPVKALEECAKEINSRTGTIIDGKFEKDLSKKAKEKWYKADYEKCRR